MNTAEIFSRLFKAFILNLFILSEYEVDSAQLEVPEEVTGYIGGSVTIPCPYELKYRDYTKYWCQGSTYDLCQKVMSTDWGQPNDKNYIIDDKSAGVFTVTMTSLTERDENTYWCVVSRRGRNVYRRVKLFISKTVTIPSSTVKKDFPPKVAEVENGSWAILRWILFFMMLVCLASTEIAVWRIKLAGNQAVNTNS